MTEQYNERQTRDLLAGFYEEYIVSTPLKYFVRMDEVNAFMSERKDGCGDYMKFDMTASCLQNLLNKGAVPVGMEHVYAECTTKAKRMELLKTAYSKGCRFRVDFTKNDGISTNRIIVIGPKNQIESYKLFNSLYSWKPTPIVAVDFFAGLYKGAVSTLPYDTFKIYLSDIADVESVYSHLASFSPKIVGLLPPFCHRKDIDEELVVGEYKETSSICFPEAVTLAMSSFVGGTRFTEVSPKRFIPLGELRRKYSSEKGTSSKLKFIDECFRSVSQRLARFV